MMQAEGENKKGCGKRRMLLTERKELRAMEYEPRQLRTRSY